MISSIDETLVDDIYEAAAMPGRWPGVLDRVAAVTGGVGGSFAVQTKSGLSRCASESLEPLLNSWMEEGWSGYTFFHERALAFREPAFFSLLDLCTPEELARDRMFNAFFVPRGYGPCLGSVFRGPGKELVRINIQYTTAHGEGTESERRLLNDIRPHLNRATLLSTRIENEPRLATEALEALGIPAAVLSYTGEVFAMNGEIEQCSAHVAIEARNSLRFLNRIAQTLLLRALAEGAKGGRKAYSIPLPARDDIPAAVAQLTPICGDARDVFGGEKLLLTIMPIAPTDGPTVELLQELYDLTPAEARLARGLTAGRSIAEIAEATGVSRDTVKFHLKSVFLKTGTSRQSALVRLLSGVPNLRNYPIPAWDSPRRKFRSI